jgi:hypothetical protein
MHGFKVKQSSLLSELLESHSNEFTNKALSKWKKKESLKKNAFPLVFTIQSFRASVRKIITRQ